MLYIISPIGSHVSHTAQVHDGHHHNGTLHICHHSKDYPGSGHVSRMRAHMQEQCPYTHTVCRLELIIFKVWPLGSAGRRTSSVLLRGQRGCARDARCLVSLPWLHPSTACLYFQPHPRNPNLPQP